MLTPVRLIKKGDEFVCDDGEVLWTAVANARQAQHRPGFTRVPVRFGDGEKGSRTWPDDTSLPMGRVNRGRNS